MSDDAAKIALYEANIARLEAQIERLKASRKRLIWVLLGLLALAAGALVISIPLAAAVVILAVSVYGVGHYIAFMHITEDGEAIAITRSTLDMLRSSKRDSSDTPLAS